MQAGRTARPWICRIEAKGVELKPKLSG